MPSRLVDLSHPIEDGMAVFPFLPAPRIRPLMTHDESSPRYSGKAEFQIDLLEMVGNVGTYLDAPLHRHRSGDDLASLPLDRLAALAGIALDGAAKAGRAVEVSAGAAEVRGRAVLVRTGWDARWGTDAYWEPGPFLSSEVVDLMVEGGAALVGVDAANVDDVEDPARPAHTRLLDAGIPIVEHLRGLHGLPRTEFTFFAVPPRVVGGAAFPVRAFAQLEA